jgi:hypothetical protein
MSNTCTILTPKNKFLIYFFEFLLKLKIDMDSEASSLNSSNFSTTSDSNSCGSQDERPGRAAHDNKDFKQLLAAAYTQQQYNYQMTSLNAESMNFSTLFNYYTLLSMISSGKMFEQLSSDYVQRMYSFLATQPMLSANNSYNPLLFCNKSASEAHLEENSFRPNDSSILSPSSISSLSSHSACSFVSPGPFSEKNSHEDKSKPFKKRHFGAVDATQAASDNAARSLEIAKDHQQRMKRPLKDKSLKKDPALPGQPKKSMTRIFV